MYAEVPVIRMMSQSLCPSGVVSLSVACPFDWAPSPSVDATDFSGNLILTSCSVVIACTRTPFDPIKVRWNFCGIMQSIVTCCSRSATISSIRDFACSTHSLAPVVKFINITQRIMTTGNHNYLSRQPGSSRPHFVETKR